MTFVREPANTGTWAVSFVTALSIHALLVGAGIAAMAPVEAPAPKVTDINVSALRLEKPDTTVATAERALATAGKAEAVAAVGGEALAAAGAQALSASNRSESLAAAESGALGATETADSATASLAEPAQAAADTSAIAGQAGAEAATRSNDRAAAERAVPAQSLETAVGDRLQASRETRTLHEAATTNPAPAEPARQRAEPARTNRLSASFDSAAPRLTRQPTESPAPDRAETSVTAPVNSTVAAAPRIAGAGAASTTVVATDTPFAPAPSKPETTQATTNAGATVASAASTARVSGTRTVAAKSATSPAFAVVTGQTLAGRVEAAGPSAETVVAAVAPPEPNRVEPLPDSGAVEMQPLDAPDGEVAGEEVETLTPEETAALYQDVLDAISGYDGGDCFAALPSIGEGGSVSFRSFARTAREIDAFANAIGDEVGVKPETAMKPISNAQCAALDFARLSPTYPQFNLFVDLAETDIIGSQVSNGNIEFQLSGTIGNIGTGYRYLAVIDDKGLVQDLTQFMSPGLSRAGFNVTLTFKGDRVDTEQIILAVIASAELTTMRDFSGRRAEAFFQRLNYESVLTGAMIDLALVSFRVR